MPSARRPLLGIFLAVVVALVAGCTTAPLNVEDRSAPTAAHLKDGPQVVTLPSDDPVPVETDPAFALTGARQAEERLENPLAVAGRHARSLVLHRQTDQGAALGARAAQSQGDRCGQARGRVPPMPAGVLQQCRVTPGADVVQDGANHGFLLRVGQ